MRPTVIAVALTVVAALSPFVAPASADCNVSATEGVSANKKLKVVPKLSGTFAFLEWDEAKKGFVETAHGTFKFTKNAEHLTAYVPDSGTHFVLFDVYAGLLVLKKDGTLVKELESADLLTAAEREVRPGRGKGCHPDGSWAKGVAFVSEGAHAQVTLFNDRVIEIDLATGAVVPVEGQKKP